MLTDDESRARLTKHAHLSGGLWYFDLASMVGHSDADATAIVKIHDFLGISPVTDVLTSKLMLSAVERIAVAEDRIARIEDYLWREVRRP